MSVQNLRTDDSGDLKRRDLAGLLFYALSFCGDEDPVLEMLLAFRRDMSMLADALFDNSHAGQLPHLRLGLEEMTSFVRRLDVIVELRERQLAEDLPKSATGGEIIVSGVIAEAVDGLLARAEATVQAAESGAGATAEQLGAARRLLSDAERGMDGELRGRLSKLRGLRRRIQKAKPR
jgi:hypothetical protein